MTGMFMTPDDALEGGAAAGKYLDSIKKTDLGQLSADEWRTFCCILVSNANRACGERFLGAWTIPAGSQG